MKNFFKKITGVALATVLAVSTSLISTNPASAYAAIAASAEDYAKYDTDRIIQEDSQLVLTSGNDRFTVEAGKSYTIVQRFLLKEGTINYDNPVFIVKSTGDTVSVDSVTVTQVDTYNYSTVRLRYNKMVEVTYELNISSLAKVGQYTYTITAYNSKVSGYEPDYTTPIYANTGGFQVTIDVVTACSTPLFALTSEPQVTGKAGEYFTIPVDMVNTGELAAYDVYVALAGNDSLISATTAMKQKVDTAEAGESIHARFTFKVDPEAKSQKFMLPITVTCRDYSGSAYSDSSYYVIVDIEGKEEFSKDSNYVVKNVVQSPENPKAGENVTLTFELQNYGDTDLKNIKLLLDNVSAAGFEPISSDPYLMLGDVEAWDSKNVTVTYKAGKNISSGTNLLSMTFDGEDKHGTSVKGSATVYVLNCVQGSVGDGASVSKPKLMVTDFSTDLTEIVAASKFNFTFKIKNTNSETTAKNIKVTVTSSNFSVTAGGNTFFIDEIKPGQEHELTINLKAGSALTTNAYPISVSMEYEYDAETKNTENGNSVTATDEILLQVSELLRAQCENISVGDWDTPVVGQNTSLSFEFYNMGKSMLSNVYVTIEGDFELATGNSYYVGNISAGNPEYIECTVRPLASGNVKCKLVVHMEDSNGDEVTRETETTVYVADSQSASYMDSGDFLDDSFVAPDYGIDDNMGINDDGTAVDADSVINPTSIKIAVAAIVVIIAGVVAIIVVKKKKKNKKSTDEFDD